MTPFFNITNEYFFSLVARWHLAIAISSILNKLEKEFNVSEQDGADIHGNLATIVQKLLKDNPEEDKLNEIKNCYLRPQTPEGAKIPY